MVKRTYNFPLPFHLSGIQDSVAVSDLQNNGLWVQVPANIQTKLQAANSWFSGGVAVTRDDLDELPDPIWQYIADKLGLSWTQ